MESDRKRARKIAKYSQQSIGAYANIEEVLRDFGTDKVIQHLRSTAGHSDRSLLENESPRLLFCQDNFEHSCRSARRVLTAGGVALGLNMPEPNDEHLELGYEAVKAFADTFLTISDIV